MPSEHGVRGGGGGTRLESQMPPGHAIFGVPNPRPTLPFQGLRAKASDIKKRGGAFFRTSLSITGH